MASLWKPNIKKISKHFLPKKLTRKKRELCSIKLKKRSKSLHIVSPFDSQELSGPLCPQSLSLLSVAHSGSQKLEELAWAARAAEGYLAPLSWLYQPSRKNPNCSARLLQPEWPSLLNLQWILLGLNVGYQTHFPPILTGLWLDVECRVHSTRM